MKTLVSILLKIIFFITSNLVFIGCSSISSIDTHQFVQPDRDVLIINTNLLSENGEEMLSGYNILIQNGQIASISLDHIEANTALVIDGKGKYLIPGLIDSHVHLQNSKNDLLVYLAHGITSVREMSGNDNHIIWSKEIESGKIGPSIEVSSEKISSKFGLWGFINQLFWNRINISSQKDVEQLVDRLLANSYSNAKISSDISRDMYFELTKVAKQRGLRVTGHIPSSITFDEFVESGQQEIAHIEELVKILNVEFGYFNEQNGREFLDFVKKRGHDMAITLKNKNISVGTTLWYMQSIPQQASNLPALINELDFSFTNPKRVNEWMPSNNEFAVNHSHLTQWWPVFSKAVELVLQELIKNEVIILVGTDAMTTLVVPGISLHQELESLVNAGMSNVQALKSSTQLPARWMGKNVGQLINGYKADLLILNSDPLINIKATNDIHAVISNGRLYSKEVLNQMLDAVRNSYSD